MWAWLRRARWEAVAKVGDVKPGRLIPVSIGDLELALGLDGDRYFAVQRRCSHRGGDLVAGSLVQHRLICPLHGWQFSTKTGRFDGVRDACLALYAVRVSGSSIEIDPTPRNGNGNGNGNRNGNGNGNGNRNGNRNGNGNGNGNGNVA